MAQREARFDGAQCDNLFASYVHLNFLARPELASRIVSAASAVSFKEPIGVAPDKLHD